MKTLFIADVHLSEKRPKVTKAFLHFLKTEAIHTKALYILGDFFELWVGDDHVTPFNQSIIQALKELTNTGVVVYIMHGNRDFALGKQFFESTGCKFLPDPCVIKLYNHCILLRHGDTLLENNFGYCFYRKIIQCSLIKKLLLALSVKTRLAIARLLSNKNHERRKHTMDEMNPKTNYSSLGHPVQGLYVIQSAGMQNDKIGTQNNTFRVSLKKVIKNMKHHHVNYFFHGHTHKPIIHQFKFNAKTAIRAVPGAWGEFKNNVLVCEPGETMLSLKFSSQKLS